MQNHDLINYSEHKLTSGVDATLSLSSPQSRIWIRCSDVHSMQSLERQQYEQDSVWEHALWRKLNTEIQRPCQLQRAIHLHRQAGKQCTFLCLENTRDVYYLGVLTYNNSSIRIRMNTPRSVAYTSSRHATSVFHLRGLFSNPSSNTRTTAWLRHA